MLDPAKLIDLVKKYPVLYDTKHEDYKNIPKRERAWEDIGYELGDDGDVMRSKWKNMKDSYAKYLRDMNVKLAKGAKKNYRNWKWAAEMEYFRPYFAFARHFDSMMSKYDDDGDADHVDQISEPEMLLEDIIKLETIEVTTIDTNLSVEPSASITTTRSKRKRNSGNTNKRKNFEDPIDLIFRGYAQAVKQFSPERQAYTKLQIANIMAQQELDHLQEQESNQRYS